MTSRLLDSIVVVHGAMRGQTPRPYTGLNLTDRGKLGSKRHPITDRQGTLLLSCATEANLHDSVVFHELIEALPAVPHSPQKQQYPRPHRPQRHRAQ